MIKLLSKILLFLTCLTTSATFSAPKIVIPTNTTIFQKTEQIIYLEKSKIGIENYAKSSIETQAERSTFHQNIFSLSSNLKGENPCVLNLPEITVKNSLNVTQFSQKEKLSLLENRARVRSVKVVSGAGNELASLFAGARQRAIAKFGKEAEDLIYVKFNKDGGAAAEILDHYGTDGLNALKKFSTIDEAAKEIVKGKTVYRAVNETTFNFDKLKTQGLIDASPTQYPTYVSLDNITDANLIKSKLQLPKKPTWVAEFDGNQIISDVRVPNGKYLNADYKEVLCRSYPDLGAGGGSQFITNSPIKVKRLVNLETGEVINFTH